MYFLYCLENTATPNSVQVITSVGAMPKSIKMEPVTQLIVEKEKSLWRTMKPMEPFSQDMVPQFQGYYQVGKSIYSY